MPQVTPRPLGETMGGTGAGDVPLLSLLLLSYSTATAWAPPPVAFPLGAPLSTLCHCLGFCPSVSPSSSAAPPAPVRPGLLCVFLPWPHLSFFSIHCPFFNIFPQQHHKLIWFVQFWGAVGQFCLLPVAELIVSGTDKINDDAFKPVTVLSVTHSSVLPFHLVAFLLPFGKILFYFPPARFAKSL